MCYFTIGYHVYKETWKSWVGEELVCKRESHNVHDPFVVAVLKADNVAQQRTSSAHNTT